MIAGHGRYRIAGPVGNAQRRGIRLRGALPQILSRYAPSTAPGRHARRLGDLGEQSRCDRSGSRVGDVVELSACLHGDYSDPAGRIHQLFHDSGGLAPR